MSPGNQICIIGGGPAGVVLSLLLARQGISVTLLEAQSDFERDFRGDTLHASSLEILDQMGLVTPVLQISHARIEKFQLVSESETLTLADFTRLDTPYPYVALIPQEKFLTFLAKEAEQFPDFQLLMNAKFHDLIMEDGKVCGIKYLQGGTEHIIKSDLIIGADGRGSRVREKAGINLEKFTPPMDVIWFKLPRPDQLGSENRSGGKFGRGEMLAILDRGNVLQLGYIIVKGSYKLLREAGIESFHKNIVKLAPELEPSVNALRDWSQCAVLSVVTGRVKRWYKPGLLLIGDAAHVMSPVGGVGINYAIQDAVAAANVLSEPIRNNHITELDLAEVQHRRESSVRFIQSVQTIIQKRLIAATLRSEEVFRPPLIINFLTKFSFFQRGLARIMAYGIHPEKLETNQYNCRVLYNHD